MLGINSLALAASRRRFLSFVFSCTQGLTRKARLQALARVQLESQCYHSFGKYSYETSLVAQMVKHLPAIRETQVRSLGWEDLLEKEMATHSSIPAWRIPGTEEPGRLQSMGSQRVGHD